LANGLSNRLLGTFVGGGHWGSIALSFDLVSFGSKEAQGNVAGDLGQFQ
jgi:hypothetical protein